MSVALLNEDFVEPQAVGRLESDLTYVRSDVSEMKTDIRTLRQDVGSLQKDVGSLQKDVGSLQKDVLRSEVSGLHGKIDVVAATLNGRIDTVVAMLRGESLKLKIQMYATIAGVVTIIARLFHLI